MGRSAWVLEDINKEKDGGGGEENEAEGGKIKRQEVKGGGKKCKGTR